MTGKESPMHLGHLRKCSFASFWAVSKVSSHSFRHSGDIPSLRSLRMSKSLSIAFPTPLLAYKVRAYLKSFSYHTEQTYFLISPGFDESRFVVVLADITVERKLET
ncbi:hypothetical protein [Methanosarcina siciliae]|uniref:hypothetical protein n=1 Tax=Methanosarcina siciliae TaxID=38027 RepID=UPI0012E0A908|nr:hypothetical protein [Methanosarcina siciliae]